MTPEKPGVYKPPPFAILPVPMSILINILLGIFVLVALLMILVILMQRPKSEGLGAAFGGGVTENIFGAQTTNVLTKFTGWLAGTFFTLTFVLSMLYAHQTNANSGLRKELMKGEPQRRHGSRARASRDGTRRCAWHRDESDPRLGPAGRRPDRAADGG